MTDIDRACEVVYEKLTGKCWHSWAETLDKETDAYYIAPDELCEKCGTRYYVWQGNSPRSLQRRNSNPPLSTSLDAWRPLWDVIGEDLDKARDYNVELMYIITATQLYVYELTPLHHLEVALRMLGENELAQKVRDYANDKD